MVADRQPPQGACLLGVLWLSRCLPAGGGGGGGGRARPSCACRRSSGGGGGTCRAGAVPPAPHCATRAPLFRRGPSCSAMIVAWCSRFGSHRRKPSCFTASPRQRRCWGGPPGTAFWSRGERLVGLALLRGAAAVPLLLLSLPPPPAPPPPPPPADAAGAGAAATSAAATAAASLCHLGRRACTSRLHKRLLCATQPPPHSLRPSPRPAPPPRPQAAHGPPHPDQVQRPPLPGHQADLCGPQRRPQQHLQLCGLHGEAGGMCSYFFCMQRRRSLEGERGIAGGCGGCIPRCCDTTQPLRSLPCGRCPALPETVTPPVATPVPPVAPLPLQLQQRLSAGHSYPIRGLDAGASCGSSLQVCLPVGRWPRVGTLTAHAGAGSAPVDAGNSMPGRSVAPGCNALACAPPPPPHHPPTPHPPPPPPTHHHHPPTPGTERLPVAELRGWAGGHGGREHHARRHSGCVVCRWALCRGPPACWMLAGRQAAVWQARVHSWAAQGQPERIRCVHAACVSMCVCMHVCACKRCTTYKHSHARMHRCAPTGGRLAADEAKNRAVYGDKVTPLEILCGTVDPPAEMQVGGGAGAGGAARGTRRRLQRGTRAYACARVAACRLEVLGSKAYGPGLPASASHVSMRACRAAMRPGGGPPARHVPCAPLPARSPSTQSCP